MTDERTLQNIAVQDSILKAELLKAFPDLAEDEQALIDTLDGISDLDCAIEEVIASAADDEAFAAALDTRMKDMKARKQRFEARAERKYAIVEDVMVRCGRRKITRPRATVWISDKQRTVIVTDPALIPADYKTTPKAPDPEPDKKAILAALKAGEQIPGAELSNAGQPQLNVRLK